MEVTLKLFSSLREYLPAGSESNSARLGPPPGSTIGSALDGLGVPPDKTLIILRNSVHADRDDELFDGDVIAVFPPIAGG